MTNTSDNNTDTSDENHINPSDNLTPKNAEPDIELINKLIINRNKDIVDRNKNIIIYGGVSN